jgi:hypothetical protein
MLSDLILPGVEYNALLSPLGVSVRLYEFTPAVVLSAASSPLSALPALTRFNAGKFPPRPLAAFSWILSID